MKTGSSPTVIQTNLGDTFNSYCHQSGARWNDTHCTSLKSLSVLLVLVFLVGSTDIGTAALRPDWQDFIDPDTLQQYLGKGMDFLYSDERIEDGFQGMSNSNDQPDKPFLQNNAINDHQYFWDNGIVPFNISQTFQSEERRNILHAMSSISSLTKDCIQFIERTSETDYIQFSRQRDCHSLVGRRGGQQVISLAPGCLGKEQIGSIQHEILHALGFYHEMSRSDRDDYVMIIWDNIKESNKRQFQIRPDAKIVGLPYDYQSVMHYPFNAFAIDSNLPTIVPTKLGAKIGQTKNISSTDVLRILHAYNCAVPNIEDADYTMTTDDRLAVGESVSSKDRKVYLKLQTDGNLVLTRSDGDVPIWSSNTSEWGKPAKNLIMQDDGNLVLYDIDDNTMWNANTAGAAEAKLTILDDESMTISKDGLVIWGYWNKGKPLACLQSDEGKLESGEVLKSWRSFGIKDFLLKCTAHDLIFIRGNDKHVIWETDVWRWGTAIAKCVMQGDGNLVLYSKSGKALWSTGTQGHPGAMLRIQDGGNIYVRDDNYYYWGVWKVGKNLDQC